MKGDTGQRMSVAEHENQKNNIDSLPDSAIATGEGKLKILMCLLYYVPHRTGLTIHVQRVAEELARRGHEVTVLTARYKLSLPRDDEMHNGVRVVRLATPPIPISRGLIMPAYPWAALGLMLQNDVVFVNTPMLETALVSVLATITGRKVVATQEVELGRAQWG